MNRNTLRTEKKALNSGIEQTHLILSIGNEHYGIDVMKVKMITGLTNIRTVPNSLPFMLGVISIQDTIVPVIDMRIKFNLPPSSSQNTNSNVIVIVTIGSRLIGLLVDAVIDVTGLKLNDVQDTPHFTSEIDSDCITGISKINDQLVIIIDTERIISKKELENLKDNND